MEYIDYKALKEFYTIPETCEIFGLEKEALKAKCEEYRVKPVRNEQGVYPSCQTKRWDIVIRCIRLH